MSTLEESIKALAESNVALAKAQTYYADTINKFGLKINEANGEAGATPGKSTEKATEKAETPAQRKKREAAEAAEAAKGKDSDGFDDEPEQATEALTADDVKKKLFEVKDAAGDKQPALDIIGEYGYKAIPEVKEKDYAKVVKDCNTWLKENT